MLLGSAGLCFCVTYTVLYAMEKDTEQPKLSKLLRSKVFWVGDYDYHILCMVRSFSSFSLSNLNACDLRVSSLILLYCPLQRDRFDESTCIAPFVASWC